MKCVITGASGFVGSAVLRQLLKAGHEVRALLRPNCDRRNLGGLSVEVVVGDLNNRKSLDQALSGCEALFHVAADYRLWVPRPDEMYRVNVEGTREIMMAAAEAGVRRIVYTSSVATLGLNSDGSPADETTPSTLANMIGHYKRSKFLAEAEVRRMVSEDGLPVVIVNPSTPVGPRDIKPTPTGKMVLEAAAGRMTAYVNTGLNFVHVDDTAEGHILAFEHGRVGERYILGGRNMTLKEVLLEVAAITGGPKPFCCLPHNLIMPLAVVTEAWARLRSKGEPLVTVDGVRLAKKMMFFSCDKAVRELGYAPRPVTEAFREAIDWFKANRCL
ncbi:MAG: NAD-dependent epimerase/dehydratase family protein [Deltaproteobacteria bacterium]|nr:NAD-dependent epimerase/dehydratase family protein [Deltaproteobacteria bacterium]